MKPINAIVTGGAGFIGSHLVEALVGLGRDVTVLDDFSNGSLDNLSQVSSRVTVVEQDVSKPFEDLLRSKAVDEIYCLACYPRQISFQNPRRDCEVNLIGTINALELAKLRGAKVAFASNTGIVSKPQRLPVDETFTPSPLTPYDTHKLASEHLLRVYANVHHVRTVVLRFASVYGPRQRVNERLGWRPVIPEFASKLALGLEPTIDGDGSQTRDFIFVKDIVDGVIGAMKSDSNDGDMFILGTNTETSIIELYHTIASMLHVDITPRHGAGKPEEIARMRYDFSKAQRTFGWSPQTSLSEGLKRTLSALASELRDQL